MNLISEIEVSYNPHRIADYKISNSRELFELVLSQWNWKEIEMLEEVKVIFLNRNNIVIGIYNLAKGGISQCTVDIRIILAVALKSVSTAIILVHNHPSGNLQPSQSDKEITPHNWYVFLTTNASQLAHKKMDQLGAMEALLQALQNGTIVELEEEEY